MKIIRNGMEIELTTEELKAATKEYIHILDLENVDLIADEYGLHLTKDEMEDIANAVMDDREQEWWYGNFSETSDYRRIMAELEDKYDLYGDDDDDDV